MYSTFEANSYDLQDSLHIGNDSHSTATGALAIYFALEEGEYIYYATEEEEKYDTELMKMVSVAVSGIYAHRRLKKHACWILTFMKKN